MWFGRDRTRRRGAAADGDRRWGAPKANTRLGDRQAGRARRLRAWVLTPLLLAAAVVLGVWLVRLAGDAIFRKNPRYTLRRLEIRCDGSVITPEHVREYTGLEEGMNLFAVNLAHLHDDFLRKTPVVKSLAIYRRLPDTIELDVSERATIARIGRWRYLGVDREGRVFNLRTSARDLPVITGSGIRHVSPGSQVGTAVMNAIELIDVAARARLGQLARIASVDVTGDDLLELYLAGGERVRLAWAGMGTGTTASRQSLEHKLMLLISALRASESRGRRISTLDLTYGDQYIPAQEY
jgi:cell division septal protein FtsQ